MQFWMNQKATLLIVLVTVAASLTAAATTPDKLSTATDAVHRRMAFMCEWVDGRYPGSWRLQPCGAQDMAEASDVDLKTSMEAFTRDYAGGADTHITRAEFELAYLHKYPTASRKPLDGELQALSVELLCGAAALQTPIAQVAG